MLSVHVCVYVRASASTGEKGVNTDACFLAAGRCGLWQVDLNKNV